MVRLNEFVFQCSRCFSYGDRRSVQEGVRGRHRTRGLVYRGANPVFTGQLYQELEDATTRHSHSQCSLSLLYNVGQLLFGMLETSTLVLSML